MPQFNFSFSQTEVSRLDAAIQELIHAAEAATEQAYAPYSHFHVGAALRLSNGSILTGANHENASFPAGLCAERVALGRHDMHSGLKVEALAVAYLPEHDGTHPPLSPCGICRQSLLEAQLQQGAPIAVYMCAPDGRVLVVDDAAHLLPFHFSSEYLGDDPASAAG